MSKKILIALVILLLLLQLIRPQKNRSETVSVNDISNLYTVPGPVQDVLKKACYDCHSNNTRYPWYAEVQPVASWLNNHIVEGKDELNFNEFGTYRIARQNHKLEEITEQVKKGEMPLGSYTLIHTDAKLTDAEKQLLYNWSTAIRDTLKAKYPADSLIMKKRHE